MFNSSKITELHEEISKLRTRIADLENKVETLQTDSNYKIYTTEFNYMPWKTTPSATYTPKQMFDLLFAFLKIKPSYKKSSISLEKTNGRP